MLKPPCSFSQHPVTDCVTYININHSQKCEFTVFQQQPSQSHMHFTLLNIGYLMFKSCKHILSLFSLCHQYGRLKLDAVIYRFHSHFMVLQYSSLVIVTTPMKYSGFMFNMVCVSVLTAISVLSHYFSYISTHRIIFSYVNLIVDVFCLRM